MKNVLLAAVVPLLLGLILPACGGEDAALAPATTLGPVSSELASSTAVSTAVVSSPAPTLPGSAVPTAVITAAPVPTSFVGPERVVPISVREAGSLRAALSVGELTCVEALDLEPALESLLFASAGEQVALMDCLEDETVLRVFLGGLTGGLKELEAGTSSCVRRGTEPLDLRSVTSSGLRGDEESALGGTIAGLLVVSGCLSEEEFIVAAPALGMGPGDREAQACIVEALGGLEELASVLAGGAGGMVALMGAVAFCGLSPGNLNP